MNAVVFGVPGSGGECSDVRYPPRCGRRSWTHAELLGLFPDSSVRVLDIGCGDSPLAVREIDELVTVDFDPQSSADVVADVSCEWPFGSDEFDLVYMSHVLEHFYPSDRDALVRNVHRSLRPGGLLFIRVPHRSSLQATGWEHHTQYGLNGATSLCHGRNPQLPYFRAISAGVALTIDFSVRRSTGRSLAERMLNRSWRLTESVLSHLVGGIPEVQFMLQRLTPEDERRLREPRS